uniref:Uncharacterized protein n=1 Tax=Aegilops tauschii subsp. strangulata TaxID=200361 RepID=A0A453BV35_AEGTS
MAWWAGHFPASGLPPFARLLPGWKPGRSVRLPFRYHLHVPNSLPMIWPATSSTKTNCSHEANQL